MAYVLSRWRGSEDCIFKCEILECHVLDTPSIVSCSHQSTSHLFRSSDSGQKVIFQSTHGLPLTFPFLRFISSRCKHTCSVLPMLHLHCLSIPRTSYRDPIRNEPGTLNAQCSMMPSKAFKGRVYFLSRQHIPRPEVPPDFIPKVMIFHQEPYQDQRE